MKVEYVRVSTIEQNEELIQNYVDGTIKTKAQLAMMLNISRPTLNRFLEEHGEG